ILAISETWLRETDDFSSLCIDGYYFIRSDIRTSTRGGSTALYICNSLSFYDINSAVPLAGLSINIVGVIVTFHRKQEAIFSIYKPPNSPLSELRTLDSCLSYVTSIADYIICMSDLNIDMLQQSNLGMRHINNILTFFSLKQIVNSPTRVTCDTVSFLDLIAISSDVAILQVGASDIFSNSDYLTVYASLNLVKPCYTQRTVLRRYISNVTETEISRKLEEVD
ncbi:hypothetical protein ALC57_07658, partial [Trachymyrmex cornetzi]